jgi:cyclopropane-fatty-acyl-phospholipid synthase
MPMPQLLNVTYLFHRAGISIIDLGIDKSKSSIVVVVHDSTFYKDVLMRGSLGLGNTYIEGKWSSENIDNVIFNILSSGFYQKVAPVYDFFRNTKSKIINLQSKKGSRKVIETHYDLPAVFYSAFLDPYFQYTCGFFEGTENLNQAQINKMHMICKKLVLMPCQSVLDIGGGWGGLAQFMTEHYRVKPVVVTLSKEQANYIRANYSKVEVLECDYREVPDKLKGEKFDAISAVGIFEHIGHKNYKTFMSVVNQCLSPGGRFLLQTIYTLSRQPEQNPWVEEHIFPNSEIPTKKLVELSARRHFTLAKDNGFQELTPNYCKTLLAWNDNLKNAVESKKLI